MVIGVGNGNVHGAICQEKAIACLRGTSRSDSRTDGAGSAHRQQLKYTLQTFNSYTSRPDVNT